MKKKFFISFLTFACALSCILPLAACGGKNDGVSKHEHVYSDEWQYDKTHHWLTCTVSGCNKKKMYSEHIFQSDGYCACGMQDLSKPTKELTYELNNDGMSYTVTGVDLMNWFIDDYIVIPSTYEGLPVTEIGYEAFANLSDVHEFIIPDSVQFIRSSAFAFCRDMTHATIPDSVLSISTAAFCGCSSLESVSIGNGIRGIAANAFYSCNELLLVDFTGDMRDWCDCSGTENLIAENRTIRVDGKALAGKIEIPDGVKTILSYSFEGLDSITGVSIPKSVTKIEQYAFSRCAYLTDIYYAGTRAEWSRITKGEGWNSNSPQFIVHCSDGAI